MAMAYSNDQSMLAYCTHRSSSSQIIVLNASDLTVNKTVSISIQYVWDIDFSPDDARIIVCGRYGYAIYYVSNGT